MTPLELGAMLASYALASVRLFGVAKPVSDLLPKWAQFLIVCLPISLTQFAGLVGVAHTNLDLASAMLELLVSVGIAYKGQHEAPAPVVVSATVTIPQAAPPSTPPAPMASDEEITASINRGPQS